MSRLLVTCAIALIAGSSIGCAHSEGVGSGGSLGTSKGARAERDREAALLLGGPVSWQAVSFDVTSSDPRVRAASLRAQVEWASCYAFVPALTSVEAPDGRERGWHVAAEVPAGAFGYLVMHADLNGNGRCDPSEPVWEFPVSGRSTGRETIALGASPSGYDVSCAVFERGGK